MLKNYLKIAWRNLLKNKTSSFINISGLAVGMSVAVLIGLWIWDEVSFDKDNNNNDRIAKVMQNQHLNGEIQTWQGLPYLLADALRTDFKTDFKYVTIVSRANSILKYNNKPLAQNGIYVEPNGPAMLDLKMLNGNSNALNDPNSILLSASSATALFGNTNPLNKIITLENIAVKVGGVYNDMPGNSSFADIAFIAPWQLKVKL